MANTKTKQGIIMLAGFCNPIKQKKKRDYISNELRNVLTYVSNGYFHISETDENLILFYKYKKQPYFKDVADVLLKMQEAFYDKIRHLNQTLNIELNINLKFVVHYGNFWRQKVKTENRLFGETVSEAYLLMKSNYFKSSSYILFSNSLLSVIEDYQYNISENKSIIPEVGTIYHLE